MANIHLPSLSCVHVLWLAGALFTGQLAMCADDAQKPDAAIKPDDPLSLQRGIDAAFHSGLKKIVIPAGSYRFPAAGKVSTLRIKDMSDFEIDATGVTIFRGDPAQGRIEFDNCRNVTLRGIKLINEIPPFTQGVIEAIDAQRKHCELRMHEGYPNDLENQKHFASHPTLYVFDPKTRQWKTGTWDYEANTVTAKGSGVYTLGFNNPLGSLVEAGDFFVMRGWGGNDIHIERCAGMKLIGITVLAASGFVIHESSCEGGNYYSGCTVSYGPKPPGASEAPLIAANADAFHSSRVRHGPTLENCFFEGMCDDGIAIHGSYSMVLESSGRQLFIASPWDLDLFRAGDPLRLFGKKGELAGEALVVSSTVAKDYKVKAEPKEKDFQNRRKYYCLTLDQEFSADLGYRVSSANYNGSGYVIRNNTIKNNRARGLLLKADDGLIEGNTIDGSTIAGIAVAPEAGCEESCYSRNVIIRHNTIRHTAYATTGPWCAQVGALCLVSEGAIAHQNIAIENNTFSDVNGTVLLIEGGRNVTVVNNHFENVQNKPSRSGEGSKIDTKALIFVDRCEGVKFEGNTVSGLGPANSVLLKVTPTATNVTGRTEGIKKIDDQR